MTVDKKVIGARLRAAREADPYWSRADLARMLRNAARDLGEGELPYARSIVDMIKDWERGDHTPGALYRRLYAHVLDRPESDLFAPSSLPLPLWRSQGLGGELTPEDEDRLVRAARGPSRLDGPVIESLAAILAAQRRTEDRIGAAPIIGAVRAQLNVIEYFAAEARGPIRPKVVDVAQQWAQYAGWLNIAVGDEPAASRMLGRAAEWAVEIGDVNMLGTVTSWRAYLAERVGQLGPMIGMARAAQRDRGPGPGRVYDVYLEARGHALVGDVHAADRVLAEAEQAAADADPDAARPWEYYYMAPGFFDLERGLVQEYLGRDSPRHNAVAAESVARGLAALPEGMRDAEWTVPYRAAMTAAQERV